MYLSSLVNSAPSYIVLPMAVITSAPSYELCLFISIQLHVIEIVGILMEDIVLDYSHFSFEKEKFCGRIIHELVVEI